MTDNNRLFVSDLKIFLDSSNKSDKVNAKNILRFLQFDELSIIGIFN